MKRTLIAIGLAALGVATFAEERHALASEHSFVKQQVADAEEWLRSRPYQDSARDAG